MTKLDTAKLAGIAQDYFTPDEIAKEAEADAPDLDFTKGENKKLYDEVVNEGKKVDIDFGQGEDAVAFNRAFGEGYEAEVTDEYMHMLDAEGEKAEEQGRSEFIKGIKTATSALGEGGPFNASARNALNNLTRGSALIGRDLTSPQAPPKTGSKEEVITVKALIANKQTEI